MNDLHNPVIYLDVHITRGKNKEFQITRYDGFTVARMGFFGLFFDETSIPVFEQMLNAAKAMVPRQDEVIEKLENPSHEENTGEIQRDSSILASDQSENRGSNSGESDKDERIPTC